MAIFYPFKISFMLINSLHDIDGSACILTLDDPTRCLRATWIGFVDLPEAIRGANNYLRALEQLHVPYLLNDNSNLRGPWFDTLEWLSQVWVPQASRLGLRYVAHVVQTDRQADIITTRLQQPYEGAFELQVFFSVPEAEEWLLTCANHEVKADHQVSRS